MGGSFGDLLKQAGFSESEKSEEAEPVATEAPEDTVTYGPKVVCRFQKKGRGGKTVTLVSGVTGGHDILAKTLRKQLGTGVRVEGDDLVLQGDQRERAGRWFESQGVKKVVRS